MPSADETGEGGRVPPHEVARLAGLVHLDLDPAEQARLAHDLERILAYVDELASLDGEATVAPAVGAGAPRGALGAGRDDEPVVGLEQREALAEAPRVRDGAFVVPAFVEG
jgi:aspartyl/glutamyl-tRNA(Asn/Gln) amidotransferase C subunit